MDIWTEEYWLPPKLLTVISYRQYLKNASIPLGLVFLCGLAIALFGGDQNAWVGIGLVIGVPVAVALVFVRLWIVHVKSPLLKRTLRFNFRDEDLQVFASGEFRAKVRTTDVVRARVLNEGLQLFFSVRAFNLVPWSAFESEQDRDAVIALFRTAGKLK